MIQQEKKRQRYANPFYLIVYILTVCARYQTSVFECEYPSPSALWHSLGYKRCPNEFPWRREGLAFVFDNSVSSHHECNLFVVGRSRLVVALGFLYPAFVEARSKTLEHFSVSCLLFLSSVWQGAFVCSFSVGFSAFGPDRPRLGAYLRARVGDNRLWCWRQRVPDFGAGLCCGWLGFSDRGQGAGCHQWYQVTSRCLRHWRDIQGINTRLGFSRLGFSDWDQRIEHHRRSV